MKSPKILNQLKQKVNHLYRKLKLHEYEITKGRPRSLTIQNIIALALYKQTQGIPTKKAVWKDFLQDICSYKTFVVNVNERINIIVYVLIRLLNSNRKHAHVIKHIDSTDIPVCLNKNTKRHRTMKGLAEWMNSGKGPYFGLKLHLCTDLEDRILSLSFTGAKTDERTQVMKLARDMNGIFIADAGYISAKLAHEFHKEGKGNRFFLAKPRKNMKKLMSEVQVLLYNTRMRIELNFRNLKMFYGFITSLPRSIDGYFGNYLYSIVAYMLS